MIRIYSPARGTLALEVSKDQANDSCIPASVRERLTETIVTTGDNLFAWVSVDEAAHIATDYSA